MAGTGRVLYLDIEGGWGGSSRSLGYLLEAIDRQQFAIEVWHRKPGPIIDRMAKLGVDRALKPAMLSIIPRKASNWKPWLVALPRLPAVVGLAREMAGHKADIIHLNYEGLIPLLALYRRLGGRAKVMVHIRTMNPVHWLSGLYGDLLRRHADFILYISENEQDRLQAIRPQLAELPHAVLYNPTSLERAPRRPAERQRFEIGFFGTLDFMRGADRLVDLARVLQRRGLYAHLHVYGRGDGSRKLFLFKRRFLPDLMTAVAAEGLAPWITFHGHTPDPEDRMRDLDLIVRPSRSNDPWGRDVIEAMALGVPVLSHGTYDRFVRSGETGCLLPAWDPEGYADVIDDLSANRERCSRLSEGARARARGLFDPERYARSVEAVYREMMASSA